MRTVIVATLSGATGLLIGLTCMRPASATIGAEGSTRPFKEHLIASARTDSDPAPNSAPLWSALDDSKLVRLVANCRKVGMPERLIRAVVLEKLGQGVPGSSGSVPWWQNRNEYAEPTARESGHLSRWDANAQLAALGLELLPGSDTDRDSTWLPAEKVAQLRDVLAPYEAKLARVSAAEDSGLADGDATLEARSELEHAVEQVLSPEEFFQWLMRQPDNETRNRLTDLPGFTYQDPAEFAAIFRVERQFDVASRAPDAEADRLEDERTAALKATLSPDRFAAYSRSQDYSYERECMFAQQNGLSASVAARLYDLRTDLNRRLAQMEAPGADQAADSEAITALWSKMADDVQTAVAPADAATYFEKVLGVSP